MRQGALLEHLEGHRLRNHSLRGDFLRCRNELQTGEFGKTQNGECLEMESNTSIKINAATEKAEGLFKITAPAMRGAWLKASKVATTSSTR